MRASARGPKRAGDAQSCRASARPSAASPEPLRLPSAVSGRLDRRQAKYFRSIVYGMRLCVFCVGGGELRQNASLLETEFLRVRRLH